MLFIFINNDAIKNIAIFVYFMYNNRLFISMGYRDNLEDCFKNTIAIKFKICLKKII